MTMQYMNALVYMILNNPYIELVVNRHMDEYVSSMQGR